ncbi:hypothetical protein B0H16DRAFT_1452351 [Mycena metata]|uniref:Uncharacterized protein n=1 Tax=Mycena metata TaxID=1033252 RepID=A0AAD7JT48_9AGAR|nr:hypothetical protein B0H16DRAFT_1452351 [Mycena metata]
MRRDGRLDDSSGARRCQFPDAVALPGYRRERERMKPENTKRDEQREEGRRVGTQKSANARSAAAEMASSCLAGLSSQQGRLVAVDPADQLALRLGPEPRLFSATRDVREMRRDGMLDDSSGARRCQFPDAVALPGYRRERERMKPENTTREHSSKEPKARVRAKTRTTETTQRERRTDADLSHPQRSQAGTELNEIAVREIKLQCEARGLEEA